MTMNQTLLLYNILYHDSRMAILFYLLETDFILTQDNLS